MRLNLSLMAILTASAAFAQLAPVPDDEDIANAVFTQLASPSKNKDVASAAFTHAPQSDDQDITGTTPAQLVPPPGDKDDEDESAQPSSAQCVVESPLPDVGPITCDTPHGPPGLPCYCPDGGPAPGHREPSF